MKKKILQIGPYSATGGVSTHIKRLAETFKENYDFSFIDESPITDEKQEVFNLRSGHIFKYLSLIKNADVVHIHTAIWWLLVIHILVSFFIGKKIIVTFHSKHTLTNSLYKWIIKRTLILTTKVVVVSHSFYEILNYKKVLVHNAFIPPILANEEKLNKELINHINENKDKKLIVGNAFKLVLNNNEDLYGLDLLIDIAKKIKQDKLFYKIIYVVASNDDKFQLLKKYTTIIEQENLTKTLTLLNYPLSFVNLILASDLVVRPTNTDGDALTIREALFFNKPVIASDVVDRPKGTILFKNRDVNDLYTKIKNSFETEKNPNTVGLLNENYFSELNLFYEKLYN